MEIANKILQHLKNNPQIKEDNYSNISPYFGRFKNDTKVVDEIYIGEDYTVNIYGDKLYLENNKTGKVTKRKIN